MESNITQLDLVLQYFKENPHRDIPHAEIVGWVTETYRNLTGNVFRDPDRAIRKLHQNGYLIKISKGIYRYEPENVNIQVLEDFSASQKQEIFRRDQYRCVICGKGFSDGVELHVDHIKPKDKGGKATIDNGQTICSNHQLNQTESCKKMFMSLHNLAEQHEDADFLKFCQDILETFEKHNINEHIEWTR